MATSEANAPPWLAPLAALDRELLDGSSKGLPPGARLTLGEIGGQGWNLLRQDLPLPLAVLRESALRANARFMQRFTERFGARLAPHGKTTMSPQLFALQMEHGAWAITVATLQQLVVARRFGFPRILLANQLLDPLAIAYVVDELKRDPGFEFYCLVDSLEGVRLLDAALAARPAGRPLGVLLEVGSPGGRTGARTLEAQLAVARAIKAAAPRLALTGVEGFEGLLGGADAGEMRARVEAFLDQIVALAQACDEAGLFAGSPVLLSAGGSAFYDLVLRRFQAARLRRPAAIVSRSGCYLTHDSALYRRYFTDIAAREPTATAFAEAPSAALEVWAYVQSRPEPGKAILTLGRRDISSDADWPVPLRWFRPGRDAAPLAAPDGLAAVGLNDQHAHLTLPSDAPIAVGDMLAFGVSHPCTTFDKWQLIPVVDDGYTIRSAVRTFF
ncbi:MAG: amino acid deaminase [Alphaproteobacteria bacterium]|nr:amino acid deaminase [Alphaproteobacteria bacterium]